MTDNCEGKTHPPLIFCSSWQTASPTVLNVCMSKIKMSPTPRIKSSYLAFLNRGNTDWFRTPQSSFFLTLCRHIPHKLHVKQIAFTVHFSWPIAHTHQCSVIYIHIHTGVAEATVQRASYSSAAIKERSHTNGRVTGSNFSFGIFPEGILKSSQSEWLNRRPSGWPTPASETQTVSSQCNLW